MSDEDIARLADVISERVFGAMSKFIDALNEVVRENEQLRSKLDDLEWCLYGDHDDDDDDSDLMEPVLDDEFFESTWEPEPEEDDSEPMFD